MADVSTPPIAQPVPAGSIFTPDQLKTLTSLVDTVIRRHTPEEVEQVLAALPVEADEVRSPFLTPPIFP
jgi:hypothetical protein